MSSTGTPLTGKYHQHCLFGNNCPRLSRRNVTRHVNSQRRPWCYFFTDAGTGILGDGTCVVVCSTVANREKIAAVQAIVAGNRGHAVSDVYVKLASRILFDNTITPSTRALMLSEAESLAGDHPELEYRYFDIASAKHALYQVRAC